jgi:AraC family transcriptional regulator of adaptative response/methylated-DNA-[protein]-cysteine methyltransferase
VHGRKQGRTFLPGFSDRRTLETEWPDRQKRIKTDLALGEHSPRCRLGVDLAEHFAGAGQCFEVALDAPVAGLVPASPGSFCETTSHRQQTVRIDKPGAVRTVAAANGTIHIAILIPFLRVAGRDGRLFGDGGPGKGVN